MDITDIRFALSKDIGEVATRMKKALGSDIKLLNDVNAGILENSGKQLRVILSLLVARACDIPEERIGDAWHFAAAAELLHNATLLHDDVADGSDLRRGKPTVRSFMGPGVSVLLGDYWLVKAMSEILDVENPENARVIRIFAKTLSDLAEGEMLQLQMAGTGKTEEKEYYRIIYGKTASLFEAASLSAAIAAGAGNAEERMVSEYAVNLGLAFQIKDDIFDYSPEMNVGKPLGADILERKITLPLLGALNNVSPERALQIRNFLSTDDVNEETRDRIVAFVRENGGIEYARASLDKYVDLAVRAIGHLPGSVYRDMLESLAGFVASRNF